ncbi:MAG TPA: dienelactone hydrolase family protein [Caulobacteraceae bacterium]|jgi:dienelactone hydrolase|nr:dienelactone hydrolase family protein [Caulobacteraceae bacterium]
MKTESIRYQADGLEMIGHFAWDDRAAGPRPAVLVFPEAFGLGEHAKQKAERLASELGYAALACDLHGEQKVISDLAQVMPLLGPLRSDATKVRARTAKALEALTARPEVDPRRVAAIGFCFGGTMSFELALSGADLRAAIGFHSGLQVTSPGDVKQIKGKVMALLGADDPGVTADQRTAFEATMREGGVDWQMTLYGGVVHSFTNEQADRLGRPEFARYDASADRRSWKQMSDLLAEVFA